MSKLTLTPEDAALLAEKEVGEECTAEVTLKVIKNDETGFEATVISVEPVEGYEENYGNNYQEEEEEAEEAEETEEAEEAEEAEKPEMSKSKIPRGKPALMLVIGSKK